MQMEVSATANSVDKTPNIELTFNGCFSLIILHYFLSAGEYIVYFFIVCLCMTALTFQSCKYSEHVIKGCIISQLPPL